MPKQTIERKCPECGKWTDGSLTHCNYCNGLIDPSKIIERDAAAYENEWLSNQKSKLDLFAKRIKEHKNPLVKGAFYTVYGLWLVYMGILTAILYIIAFLPG